MNPTLPPFSLLAAHNPAVKCRGRFKSWFRFGLWAPLTLAFAGPLAAQSTPASVNIIEAWSTTAVYAYAVGDNIGTYDVTRTQTAGVPLSDTLSYPSYHAFPDNSQIMAHADAGLFHVSGETTALAFDGGQARSSTFAESVVRFSPLVSLTTTIEVQVHALAGEDGSSWTAGSAKLPDMTLGSEVWNHGWGNILLDLRRPRRH